LNLPAASGTLNSSFNVVDGSELTLGGGTAAGEAFNLIPSSGFSPSAGSTTTYGNDSTGQRWLYKLGEGPLVLGNVRYTDVAGTGTTQQSQFRWQIGGSGTSSRTGVPEGPVRGLSMSSVDANSSNSLRGFAVTLAGGVYEVDNTLGTSGTLSVGSGTSSSAETRFTWSTGGGGFSAYGGNVQVILNSGTAVDWGAGAGGFNGNPLIFGSQTANAVVTLTNNISFGTGSTREVRVLDNTGTSSDYAALSGTLSGTSNLNKTGPGLLELSAANTFSGTTTVSSGTLRLANNQALQSATLDTSGAGLVALSSTVTTPTFGALVGSRNLSTVFDSSSYSTLTRITLNRSSGTSTYTGLITDGASGMAITMSGAGVQELTGANSYTGTTTITTGTLRLGIANLPGNIANSAGLEILQGGTTTGTASGEISGAGSLTMINGGVVRLANTANTYTGVTTISSGVLEVAALADAGSNSSLGAPAVASGTIGLGSSTTSGTLSYVGAGAASTNRSFSLAGNGGIAANGGDALTISGTVTGAAANFTLSGTSTVLNSLPSINGAGVSVTKTGPGTWRLTGQSTYGGGLTVLDGTLIAAANQVGSNSPFGGNTTAAVIGDATAASGTAALLLASGVTIAQSITVGSGVGQQVELGGIGSGTFASSQITLGRNVTLRAATGSTVTFLPTWVLPSGTSSTVGFTIGSSTNAGTVVFGSSVASSVVNAVNVVSGTLQIDATNLMGFGIPLTLGSASSNGAFDLRSFSQRLASLTFTGVGSTVSSTGTGTLRLFNSSSAAAVNVLGTGVAHQISAPVALDDASTFNVDSAARLAVSGLISNGTNGSRNLTKTGLGTLELSGQNSYTGNTAVNQGTLVVNGRLAGGALSVAAGATLMGSGTIGGAATIAGIHSPGNSPGIQPFASNLTYTGGTSQVIWELWGNTDSLESRGVSYDGIDVLGTLDFAALTTLTLNFGGTGVGSVAWSNSFWNDPKQWTLFTVTGTTTNFSNFQLANNPASWVDSTGQAFSASSRNTNTFNVVQSGNNIVLQYVPEPTAVTLALIGIAASVYVASRRRS
jgi:autotransporter-associated beta strand protein